MGFNEGRSDVCTHLDFPVVRQSLNAIFDGAAVSGDNPPTFTNIAVPESQKNPVMMNYERL